MNPLSDLLPIFAATALQAQTNNPGGTADERGWQVVVVTFLSSFLAQFVKVLAKLFTTGKLDLRILAKTGGMPSSHSCCTMGMATSVGIIEGYNSVSFAIALCLASIVMYDAAGVRRTVGLQARVLNKMIEEIFSEHPHISGERIKEFLGHTPKEVLVGALFGIAIAYTFNYWAVQRP
ncbi:MAG: divergent PAP2 family protein [Candidatus Obscuribacterales bacterium]|jgi:acid phosphatase family membrane protein YuiD|nr:divergent PAP2 family protein [Candidatus Obscuribacterales bacterium]